MTSKPSWAFDIDRLSEAVNGLQKCLECTICLDLMTTPVKTRCGHSFCQICIGKVLRQNASCPLCKELLNKRSISKDDHLESCIQKFKNLLIVIETDSHIDVLSHLKQPRDTRESCSNSGSSLSSVSQKRKRTRKRSSNQSTSKTERPSPSRRTVIDCDNPRHNANSSTQPGCDQTSSTLTDVYPLSIDGNDNTLYDTPDVKVRTWIHSLIESDPCSTTTSKAIEDETRPSEKNTPQVDKDTKRRRSRDTKKTDTDSNKLKYNAIHAKIRMKDHKSFAEKSDSEQRINFRDGSSLATSNNQTHQVDVSDCPTNASTVGDKPLSSADSIWSVKEIGKEMRWKKKKMKKLSVSIEKITGKSIEKCNETSEKNIEKTLDKSKSVPRIIEDIMLLPNRKYESFNKSATDASNKETNVPNQSRESHNWKQDKKPVLSNEKIKTEVSANETIVRNLEESFANDKTNSSRLEANSSMETSLVITLAEGEKTRIKNLNSRQMNEIIGFEGNSKGLVDNANVDDRKRHLKEEDKEQEEDMEIMTELFDSPSSHRQRLIILTPEKLNESVDKSRTTHDSGLQTPVSKLAIPTPCLPTGSRTPHNAEGTTMGSREEALRLQNRSRLSLKRNPKIVESPSFSQLPLMERLLINDFDSTNSKGRRKSVDSSMSNDGPCVDRLATVRRDLSSQINDGERSSTDQTTTAAGVSSKNTVAVKDNNVSGNVCQDKRLSVESTGSMKSKRIDNRAHKQDFSVKFMQLGTLIRRRNVKYYYQDATKRERRLPAEIRVASIYNMQSSSKNELQYFDRSHSFESSFIPSDSQDSTGVTVVEDMHYVHKSAMDNTVLETTRLTYIPASSTPKTDADRHLDRAETIAQRSSSTSVINKPSVAEETIRLPHTPRADQNTTQQGTPRVHSHTTIPVKLLSPDKDSQLRFLTIESPMSQREQSRLASSTRPMQSELERGLTSTKDSNLAEMNSSQQIAKALENSEAKPVQKRKRNDDDDDSSVSAVSVSSQCTVKLDSNRKDHKNQGKSSHSNADKKRRLSSSRDRSDEVICLDPDDRRKAHERKFKRIVSISDSDTESEPPARVAKKLNRNKSGNRCDQENASITSTPKRRKALKRASDEDLRIRNIVDKWSNEYNATRKRPTEETRSAQDTVKPAKLTFETHRRSSFSTNSSEMGEKRGSAKLSEKNTESELFFESNSVFNSEGLEQLATRQSDDKSSKSRKEHESSSSMDLLTDDIINKVLQINRLQQSNPGACQSTGVASWRKDDGTSQRGKSLRLECNLLQDNFDEVIANVELPQSEDVIPCSELPAHRNPDRNLNRTLTEQNTSSSAMTNESRDVAWHGQMKPASSTADIFEYCSSAGKSAKKTHPTNASGNSDKENTVSHGQRKYDHPEEDRRDKKNVARSSDAFDKAGREKIVSKNNVSQEQRGSFDHVEVTERMPRMEKEINVPARSTNPANDNSKVQKKVSDENESNEKDSLHDSLMNITAYQARLKMIEEDLFGAMPAWIAKNLDDLPLEEQRTPKKRKKGVHEKNTPSQEFSADEDDIVENTPETKMRKNGSGGKTVVSGTRRNIMTLNLSPIPSFSEQLTSTSPRKRATSKSEHASTPLCRPNLMCPLYQSTPKVTSSTTTGRCDDVATTGNKGQLDKQHAMTTSAVSSSTKRTAGDNASGNACRRSARSDRERLRFVCTGLTAAQIMNVQKFARLHNADYARQFDSGVTHVIVNTIGEENAAKSTLKYLQGIAHCKWVVSYKWVEDCIGNRRLLAEYPYEATTQSTDTNGPGPRNSRLSCKGLFEDFTFLCVGPYDNVSLSQYQDLLRATGATVVNSLQALVTENKGLKGIVIQGDTHENSKIETWYRDARAPPILIDWVVECIGHYRLFHLIPYIQTLSPQDYCAVGYPREIVGEDEYSDNSG